MKPGIGEQLLHPLGRDELVEIVRALRDPAEALAERDHQQLRPAGRVGGRQDQQAARREPRRQRLHESRGIGDMLDHLHRGDEVELAVELLTVAGAIIDRQPLRRGMVACDRDQLGRGVDPGDLRAQPRQRLGEQPRAAADIERGLSFQRACGCIRRPANAGRSCRGHSEPHRVQFVQHRRGAVRVPPVAAPGCAELARASSGQRCLSRP